jgi:hypothetical protein
MARWADAIDSGDYSRGDNALHRISSNGRHTYCCLGVLCELAVADGIISAGTQSTWTGDKVDYSGQVAVLPQKVADWAGLGVNPGFGGKILAIANDQGTPWSIISSWIRTMGAVNHGPLQEPQAQVQDRS